MMCLRMGLPPISAIGFGRKTPFGETRPESSGQDDGLRGIATSATTVGPLRWDCALDRVRSLAKGVRTYGEPDERAVTSRRGARQGSMKGDRSGDLEQGSSLDGSRRSVSRAVLPKRRLLNVSQHAYIVMYAGLTPQTG